MKRIVFFIVGIGILMSVSNIASAYEWSGIMQQIGPNSWNCISGPSWCIQSVDPTDPNPPQIGEWIRVNLPGIGIETVQVVNIQKTQKETVLTVQDDSGVTTTVSLPTP